jgi:hypothetical protein
MLGKDEREDIGTASELVDVIIAADKFGEVMRLVDWA